MDAALMTMFAAKGLGLVLALPVVAVVLAVRVRRDPFAWYAVASLLRGRRR